MASTTYQKGTRPKKEVLPPSDELLEAIAGARLETGEYHAELKIYDTRYLESGRQVRDFTLTFTREDGEGNKRYYPLRCPLWDEQVDHIDRMLPFNGEMVGAAFNPEKITGEPWTTREGKSGITWKPAHTPILSFTGRASPKQRYDPATGVGTVPGEGIGPEESDPASEDGEHLE